MDYGHEFRARHTGEALESLEEVHSLHHGQVFRFPQSSAETLTR